MQCTDLSALADGLTERERTALLCDPAFRRLPAVFAAIPDPRARQGRRYDLPFLLTGLVAALLCTCNTLTAVGQWCRDHETVLARVFPQQRFYTPTGALFRWLLPRLWVAELEWALAPWVRGQADEDGQARATAEQCVDAVAAQQGRGVMGRGMTVARVGVGAPPGFERGAVNDEIARPAEAHAQGLLDRQDDERRARWRSRVRGALPLLGGRGDPGLSRRLGRQTARERQSGPRLQPRGHLPRREAPQRAQQREQQHEGGKQYTYARSRGCVVAVPCPCASHTATAHHRDDARPEPALRRQRSWRLPSRLRLRVYC